MNTGIN